MTERTDRELLELAAKAAGVVIDRSAFSGGGYGNSGFTVTGDMVIDWHNGTTWNPLTDDGDALRLAVKLGAVVGTFHGLGYSSVSIAFPDNHGEAYAQAYHNDHAGDQCAATRRAIVRAAAEIGAKE